MLHPAPTTEIDPTIARGLLEEHQPATATKPEHVVISFHNLNYRMHLRPLGTVTPGFGGKVRGVIRANAKRVDRVETGGRLVDPVFGMPRRVQGRVVKVAAERNELVVHAGMPIHCRLTERIPAEPDRRQLATDYPEGDLVSFYIAAGATFEQQP